MSVTLFIIIATCAISVLALSNTRYFYKLEFNPYLVHRNRQWYRLFSHAFIHADWIHLFVNMYVLYSFGSIVEQQGYAALFGPKGKYYYLLLYAGGIIFSSLPAFRKHRDNAHYNAVGASGAVSAIVFASIVLNPLSRIYLFFIPIGIPAFIFGILYLVFEAYMDKRSRDNIAHDAHFWGAVFGVVFTIALKPVLVVYFLEQILP